LKSFRKRLRGVPIPLTAGLAVTFGVGAAIGATVPSWQQWIEAGTAVDAALYRSYDTPRGAAMAPRPPKEAAADLAGLADAGPDRNAAVAAAWKYEEALDFPNAEARWKQAAGLAADRAA
jgi:hypothetical protein